MRFPSDDELMAGPNALEGGLEIDLPEDADEDALAHSLVSNLVEDRDVDDDTREDADGDEGDLEDADEETAHSAAVDLEELKRLRKKAGVAPGLVMPDFPDDFRAGFVTIIGRPNVGKSTLTNALVGHKVAITSGRPETTRHNIRGIVHSEKSQLVLVDTPGYHRPRTLLGKRLNEMVREALSEVDVVVFCLPADQHVGPGDRFIARELRDVRAPKVAVVTKTDLVGRERLLKHLLEVDAMGEWSAIVPVSAVEDDQIDELERVLVSLVPLSPPLYPDGDVTDESRDTLIAEYVREAALEGVRDELPHSLAVQVEEITEREPKPGQKTPPLLDIHVNLFVERDSQKAIIIGKRGSRLRDVGTRSRAQIEELLGRRVFLDLHVRTAKDWQSDPKMLGRLGF